jgi:type IV pilus assembly protein PilE
MRNNASKGFTLIELLVTVAIVAILAAIAVPSYQGQIKKSRRADAKSALLELTQFMEKTYTENNTYRPGAPAADPTLPFTQTPKDGTTKYYNLTISASTGTSYTLLATPIAGTSQATDGMLDLSNTGVKRWDANNNGAFEASENQW